MKIFPKLALLPVISSIFRWIGALYASFPSISIAVITCASNGPANSSCSLNRSENFIRHRIANNVGQRNPIMIPWSATVPSGTALLQKTDRALSGGVPNALKNHSGISRWVWQRPCFYHACTGRYRDPDNRQHKLSTLKKENEYEHQPDQYKPAAAQHNGRRRYPLA